MSVGGEWSDHGQFEGAWPEEAIHENYADRMWSREIYSSEITAGNCPHQSKIKGLINLTLKKPNLSGRGAQSTVHVSMMGVALVRFSEVVFVLPYRRGVCLGVPAVGDFFTFVTPTLTLTLRTKVQLHAVSS